MQANPLLSGAAAGPHYTLIVYVLPSVMAAALLAVYALGISVARSCRRRWLALALIAGSALAVPAAIYVVVSMARILPPVVRAPSGGVTLPAGAPGLQYASIALPLLSLPLPAVLVACRGAVWRRWPVLFPSVIVLGSASAAILSALGALTWAIVATATPLPGGGYYLSAEAMSAPLAGPGIHHVMAMVDLASKVLAFTTIAALFVYAAAPKRGSYREP